MYIPHFIHVHSLICDLVDSLLDLVFEIKLFFTKKNFSTFNIFFNYRIVVMSLKSSSEDQLYFFADVAFNVVNEHADSQNYAVVIARTKAFKTEVRRKIWMRCDREDKHRELENQIRIHESSRLIECSFNVVAKRVKDEWALKIVSSEHNHSSTLTETHSILRRMTMTEKIQLNIARQIRIQNRSSKILLILRLDVDEKFSLFHSRDIYNAKIAIRRKALESLTSVQILMRQLNDDDWKFDYQKNDRDQITHLFFFKASSHRILKINHEILLMNCIYKINRYKMSLLIIIDQTALHIIFYVAFVFIFDEKEENYRWILRQLKSLYQFLSLSALTALITDCDKRLIIVIRKKYAIVNHLLCIWHINNNVLTNCKRQFVTTEKWKSFFDSWKIITKIFSFDEFNITWNSFQTTYNSSHSNCVSYILSTYIDSYKWKFVKYWTDQMFHFKSTVEYSTSISTSGTYVRIT